MSYDDHEAAGNTVAWGFGDASPAPGGKWGGIGTTSVCDSRLRQLLREMGLESRGHEPKLLAAWPCLFADRLRAG